MPGRESPRHYERLRSDDYFKTSISKASWKMAVPNEKKIKMKWTKEHELLLCREVLVMKPYKFKPSTKESGAAWTGVADDLNAVTEIEFQVTQKSVRDHCKLLLNNFKSRMRQEEGASGINTEPTEIDTLLTEIKEEWDEATENYDELKQQQVKEQEKSREQAEEIRTIAMENLANTQKRKCEESPSSSKRRTGSETLVYLMTKLESDKETKQEELELKRKSLENQTNLQNNFAVLLNQQQQQINQQNQLMLRILESMTKKY